MSAAWVGTDPRSGRESCAESRWFFHEVVNGRAAVLFPGETISMIAQSAEAGFDDNSDSNDRRRSDSSFGERSSRRAVPRPGPTTSPAPPLDLAFRSIARHPAPAADRCSTSATAFGQPPAFKASFDANRPALMEIVKPGNTGPVVTHRKILRGRIALGYSISPGGCFAMAEDAALTPSLAKPLASAAILPGLCRMLARAHLILRMPPSRK